MRLLALRIQNFRAFQEGTTITSERKTAFVGGTSSGKTTILEGLGRLVSPRRAGAIDELDVADQTLGIPENSTEVLRVLLRRAGRGAELATDPEDVRTRHRRKCIVTKRVDTL